MLSHSTKWDELKLGDLFEKIIGGGTPSKAEPSYWRGNIPWASVKDMADGVYRVTSTIDHITELGLKNSVSNLVPKGTVIISTRMGLGRCFMADMDIAINQDLKALFPNGRVIPEFLLWLMVYLGSRIESMGSGTTVKGIRLEQLKDLDINLPPLPTQRKIASILSAYDNLIENNTRRIKILEEMAQALYREWFVKFRFPGHDKVKMVESELGMVPEGWEAVTIRDVSNYINRGVSPKYDDQSSQIVINQKCIRDGKFNPDLVRRHASKIPVEKSIRFGDVLINSTGIGTLGRIAQIYMEIPDCTVDSHVTIVRPNDKVSIDYFGSYLSTLEPHFDSQGVGSTGQTELGRETIAKTSFLLPSKCIQDRFSEIISPMYKSIVKMFAKNANLRRTRDLMLPKLISGEVDVEKIDVLMAQ